MGDFLLKNVFKSFFSSGKKIYHVEMIFVSIGPYDLEFASILYAFSFLRNIMKRCTKRFKGKHMRWTSTVNIQGEEWSWRLLFNFPSQDRTGIQTRLTVLNYVPNFK